jgi:hypothetical protein
MTQTSKNIPKRTKLEGQGKTSSAGLRPVSHAACSLFWALIQTKDTATSGLHISRRQRRPAVFDSMMLKRLKKWNFNTHSPALPARKQTGSSPIVKPIALTRTRRTGTSAATHSGLQGAHLKEALAPVLTRSNRATRSADRGKTDGIFWKPLPPTTPNDGFNPSLLLDDGAWSSNAGRSTANSGTAASIRQLVIVNFKGRSGNGIANAPICKSVLELVDKVVHKSADSLCPACNKPLSLHSKGDIFLNAMGPSSMLAFHKDLQPPTSSGFIHETSIIILVNPAREGGSLRVSSLKDGSATKAGTAGGHLSRDTDVLPMTSAGDTVWLDGASAQHRVDCVRKGTRVSLCIGMCCPLSPSPPPPPPPS